LRLIVQKNDFPQRNTSLTSNPTIPKIPIKNSTTHAHDLLHTPTMHTRNHLHAQTSLWVASSRMFLTDSTIAISVKNRSPSRLKMKRDLIPCSTSTLRTNETSHWGLQSMASPSMKHSENQLKRTSTIPGHSFSSTTTSIRPYELIENMSFRLE